MSVSDRLDRSAGALRSLRGQQIEQHSGRCSSSAAVALRVFQWAVGLSAFCFALAAPQGAAGEPARQEQTPEAQEPSLPQLVVLLRDGTVLRNPAWREADENGILLADQSRLRWGQIAQLSSTDKQWQQKLEQLREQLGPLAQRFELRMDWRDYAEASKIANQLQPKLQDPLGDLALRARLAVILDHWHTGQHELAVLGWLRLFDLLRNSDRGAGLVALAARHNLDVDPSNGHCPQLVPLFFDAAAARAILDELQPVDPADAMPVHKIYLAALAVAAGDWQQAEKWQSEFPQRDGVDEPLGRWCQLVSWQIQSARLGAELQVLREQAQPAAESTDWQEQRADLQQQLEEILLRVQVLEIGDWDLEQEATRRDALAYRFLVARRELDLALCRHALGLDALAKAAPPQGPAELKLGAEQKEEIRDSQGAKAFAQIPLLDRALVRMLWVASESESRIAAACLGETLAALKQLRREGEAQLVFAELRRRFANSWHYRQWMESEDPSANDNQRE